MPQYRAYGPHLTNTMQATIRQRARRADRVARGLPAYYPGAVTAWRNRPKMRDRPFCGVDGEGAGQDRLKRQLYLCLRAGERELYTGQHLGTVACLDFLLGCDPNVILVGFSFGYDTTMILRDLPGERPDDYDPKKPHEKASRRDKLFLDKTAGSGHSRYTYWGDYGIEYLPRNYLRVCRTVPVIRTKPDGTRTRGRAVVKGSTRTVWDVFAFFQCKFTAALTDWDVGTLAQREWIAANKERRDTFETISQVERDYCALECELLADMMERFRVVCTEAEIMPRTWSGAGKLSEALHKMHGTITAAGVAEALKDVPDVLLAASQAYYGGRFEITRTGEIAGDSVSGGNAGVHEYDLKSAYPAMMQRLPCLIHGEWERVLWPDRMDRLLVDIVTGDEPDDIFVAHTAFSHHSPTNLCGLPIRKKDGRLFWPMRGQGVYWSPEIVAALELGCRPNFPNGGWRYRKRCDCHPFDWVEALFQVRMSIGGGRGIVIKLGINGLYGKLAQRIGNPRYANLIWAGLITAMTRAALMTAAAESPDSIVMLATDALYSVVPLAGVAIAPDMLGGWAHKKLDRMFVVQPGLYWGPEKPKTRGVNPSFFKGKTGEIGTGPVLRPPFGFEGQWAAWCEDARAAVPSPASLIPPVHELPLRLFTGLRLAQSRGKPDTAGCWIERQQKFSFDWKGKRTGREWISPHCVGHRPHPGAASLISEPHRATKALLAALDGAEIERAELDEQPDHIDLGPPT